MTRRRNELPRTCKACNRRRWATEADAIAEAVRRMARGGPSRMVYACPHGNQWHVTGEERLHQPTPEVYIPYRRKARNPVKGAR